MNHIFVRLLLFAACAGIMAGELSADIKRDGKSKEKGGQNEVQRDYNSVRQNHQNTVSNLDFYNSNYGIFGFDVRRGVGGTFWPRGSQNQYIFAGGVWLAAQKYHNGAYRKYCTITYNPNNGNSWMVPGRIEDQLEENSEKLLDYRVFFSTDFSPSDGKPIDTDHETRWPVWDINEDDSLKVNRYFGHYVEDPNLRDKTNYPKGPAFISGEDIFSTFKDTDLSFYDDGAGQRAQMGYPLGLQYEHTIYSWGFGDYKDFIFLKYDIINWPIDPNGYDTLFNCWLAPVLDVDIALRTASSQGAANDRVNFYDFCGDQGDTLNLAFQWSNTDRGELGRGFGYLGFDFLETPAVKKCEGKVQKEIDGVLGEYCWQCVNWEFREVEDPDTGEMVIKEVCSDSIFFTENEIDFVRQDKRAYLNKEQLGLVTFRNWPIQEDPNADDQRYNFISSGVTDGDDGPGDKRFMMASGPFSILPGDTIRVVYAIVLANAAVRENPDGTCEDLEELIKKDKFAQEVYDNNFRAPSPPDRARNVQWEPLNNAVKVTWEFASDLSSDPYEEGLDFMGYKIYRARDPYLDTFDLDEITPNLEYTSGKGPFGWRELASWEIQRPYHVSTQRGGLDQDDLSIPLIDSLRILGPVVKQDGTLDSFKIEVIRVPTGVRLFPASFFVDEETQESLDGRPLYPVINKIDTGFFASPWGSYYKSFVPDNQFTTIPVTWGQSGTTDEPYLEIRSRQNNQYVSNYLIDSVMRGTIELNKAFFNYNPLYMLPETVVLENPDDAATLSEVEEDGTVNLLDSFEWIQETNGTERLTYQRLKPIGPFEAMANNEHLNNVLDSIYMYIQKSLVEFHHFDFESDMRTKTNVIIPYFDRITNNRTFYDIGDVDRDNKIDTDDDPSKTEKLINSIDYYYKVIAWDLGDYKQPTPRKFNTGGEGLPNTVQAYPAESYPGDKATFRIISEDTDKLGSLHNFRFFPLDQERINQLFAGDTLKLEFEPYWTQSQLTFTKYEHYFGLYRVRMRLTNESEGGALLYDRITALEPRLCEGGIRQLFTEDAASYVLADSLVTDSVTGNEIRFGLPYQEEEIIRSGRFSTGDFTIQGFCYTLGFNQPALGTLGFSFDYTMLQKAGRYRPEDVEVVTGDAATPIHYVTDVDTTNPAIMRDINPDAVLTTQWVSDDTLGMRFGSLPGQYILNPIYGSFNNGPGDYLVTFKPGGTETMTLFWGRDEDRTEATFEVPYLTYEVENTTSFNRKGLTGDSVEVTYAGIMEHLILPEYHEFAALEAGARNSEERAGPDPRNLGKGWMDFVGKYNAHSYAWANARDANPIELRRRRAWDKAKPLAGNDDYSGLNIGAQGRYYLSAMSQNGQHQVDFQNILNIAGAWFIFDYVNTGYSPQKPTSVYNWGDVDDYTYGEDFQAGDQVMLSTTGGALGFPMPGASVLVKIDERANSGPDVTDDELEQVQIVPNPYYLSHIGQQSPYDAKIYFTKLPPQATIDIYTVTGSRVVTLEHDEYNSESPDRMGVELWGLLSRNNQRVQSQTLTAVITTPKGAQVVKNFTVVVGGFRLITEEE